MSESVLDLTKALVPTSTYSPGHQLPTRAFVEANPSKAGADVGTPQSAARAQQIDTGVMQTLNLQAKLAIGAPGDRYEQEADQVASQVVQQINSPQTQAKSIQREGMEEEELMQGKFLVQRQGMEEEELMQGKFLVQREGMEEEELQAKPLADSIQREGMEEEELMQGKFLVQREGMEEEELMQGKSLMQRKADGAGVASTELESSIAGARGQGQPLNQTVREPMEQAFGADFSGVRVHADAQAHGLNQSIQARAFTTGQDIFFRQGEYQPGNRSGQELLAHELTHVVQQNGSAVQSKKQH